LLKAAKNLGEGFLSVGERREELGEPFPQSEESGSQSVRVFGSQVIASPALHHSLRASKV